MTRVTFDNIKLETIEGTGTLAVYDNKSRFCGLITEEQIFKTRLKNFTDKVMLNLIHEFVENRKEVFN